MNADFSRRSTGRQGPRLAIGCRGSRWLGAARRLRNAILLENERGNLASAVAKVKRATVIGDRDQFVIMMCRPVN